MSGWRTGLRWAVAAAGALALLSAINDGGFRRYFLLRSQITALEQRNRQLAQDNERMTREVGALRKDPQAIERAAREELGFIKPGEVVINLEAP